MNNKYRKIGNVAASAFICLLLIGTISDSHAQSKSEQAREFMKRGLAAIEYENFGEASDYFQKIVELDIKLPETFYFHYGRIRYNMGELEDAYAYFQNYLNITGSDGKYAIEADYKMKKIEENLLFRQYTEDD